MFAVEANDVLARLIECGSSTLRTARHALKNERSKMSSARNQALENEQKQIRLTLEDSSLFAKDPAQATALFARDAEIDAALMAALERWEQLSA